MPKIYLNVHHSWSENRREKEKKNWTKIRTNHELIVLFWSILLYLSHAYIGLSTLYRKIFVSLYSVLLWNSKTAMWMLSFELAEATVKEKYLMLAWRDKDWRKIPLISLERQDGSKNLWDDIGITPWMGTGQTSN